jgi:hypothetical protein
MTPQEAFVTRLRRNRERWGVPLADIAAATRVKPELFEAFERGDLSSWPRGLYARAWVRAYALAVGVDPFETVEEFCRLFPNGDRRAQAMMEEIASIVASSSGYRDEFNHVDRRDPVPQVKGTMKPSWRESATHAVLRLVRAVRAPRTARPARMS